MTFSFKIKSLSFLLLTFIANTLAAQHTKENYFNDTLPSKTLDNVIVNAKLKASNSAYMPDVVGNSVYAGKRTNTVKLSPGAMGLSLNLGRTVLAKTPGLTMWEIDGAGTQLNIGSRGNA